MKTKSIFKKGFITGVALGLGYIAGSYIGQPFNQGALSGDIGKVKKHNEKVVSEEFKAIENRLKTDQDFKNQTQFTLGFVASRVGEFQANAEIAAEAASKVKGMEKEAAQMSALAVTAANASNNAGDALEALMSLYRDGNSDFESFLNNAYTAFMLLNTTSDASRDFVAAADAHLANPDNANNGELAFARDLWVSYNIGDAVYNNDKEAFAYWTDKGVKYSEEQAGKMLAAITPSQQTNLVAGMMCNIALSNTDIVKKSLNNMETVALNTQWPIVAFRNIEGLNNMSLLNQSPALDALLSAELMSALSNSENLSAIINSSSVLAIFNNPSLNIRNSESGALGSSMMNSVLSNMSATTLNIFI